MSRYWLPVFASALFPQNGRFVLLFFSDPACLLSCTSPFESIFLVCISITGKSSLTFSCLHHTGCSELFIGDDASRMQPSWCGGGMQYFTGAQAAAKLHELLGGRGDTTTSRSSSYYYVRWATVTINNILWNSQPRPVVVVLDFLSWWFSIHIVDHG